MSLLSVSGLNVSAQGQPLLRDVSFGIGHGERLGVIGESGSGKSLTALAVMGLLPRGMTVSGSVRLDGQQVVGAAESRLLRLRGAAAAVVFQEPLSALDPLMRLGRQVAEPLRLRATREGRNPGRRALDREVLDLLAEVALPEPDRIARAYPHEVSGGQRQRVAIAMALACRPKLLIADEPSTALDVTTQAEILSLLNRLVAQNDMALMFISHDLAVVGQIASRVAVMEHGRIVEAGPMAQVLNSPQHAYSRSLVDAARAFDRALGDAP